ncbi:MAG: TetR/AcrR family transcriptional regulator [Oscillospiraceae bacterium]
MKTNKLELIYNATISLIKRLGIDQVSVSKIAKEAGIGKGSIYYYVDTKNDIINGIAIQTVKRIVQEYQLIVAQKDFNVFEKMRLLFNATSNRTFVDGSSNDMHILFIQPDMYLHQRLNSAFMRYLVPILENLLIEGTEKNILKSTNPRKAAELIIMTMLMVFDGKLLPTQERLDTIERMNYLSDIIEKSLSAPEGSLRFFDNI